MRSQQRHSTRSGRRAVPVTVLLAALAGLAVAAFPFGGGDAMAVASSDVRAETAQAQAAASKATTGARRCNRVKRKRAKRRCRATLRCDRLKSRRAKRRCKSAVRRRGAPPTTGSPKAGGPQPGVYRGKVGTFARIVFTVTADGRVVTELNAGVKTNCQRSSDGYITETKVVSTAPAAQQPPARLSLTDGRFSGRGQDENGAAWRIAGAVAADGTARGTFEASLFEFVFNPYVYGGGDGQLCAGSGDWSARLSDG